MIKHFFNFFLQKKNKASDKIAMALIVLGAICTPLGFIYQRVTFVNLNVLLSVYFIPGIILTPIFFNILNKKNGRVGHWFLHYSMHTIIIGSLTLYLFMASNYYLATLEISNKAYDIIGNGGFGKNQTEHVIINFHEQERKIFIPEFDKDSILKMKKIRLKIFKGYWNYDVIKNIEIVK